MNFSNQNEAIFLLQIEIDKHDRETKILRQFERLL